MAVKPDATLDTSVIIRFLTGDDRIKQVKSAKLLEQVQTGKVSLYLPDTAVADCVYVLFSKAHYNLPRNTVSSLLTPIIKIPEIKLNHKQITIKALEVYANFNIDFGDALIVASNKLTKQNIIFSFDTDFDKIPNVTRQEPD